MNGKVLQHEEKFKKFQFFGLGHRFPLKLIKLINHNFLNDASDEPDTKVRKTQNKT